MSSNTQTCHFDSTLILPRHWLSAFFEGRLRKQHSQNNTVFFLFSQGCWNSWCLHSSYASLTSFSSWFFPLCLKVWNFPIMYFIHNGSFPHWLHWTLGVSIWPTIFHFLEVLGCRSEFWVVVACLFYSLNVLPSHLILNPALKKLGVLAHLQPRESGRQVDPRGSLAI